MTVITRHQSSKGYSYVTFFGNCTKRNRNIQLSYVAELSIAMELTQTHWPEVDVYEIRIFTAEPYCIKASKVDLADKAKYQPYEDLY